MEKFFSSWFGALSRANIEEFYNKYIDDKVLDERKIRDISITNTKRFGLVMVISFDLDSQCMYLTEYGILKDIDKKDEQFLIYSPSSINFAHVQHVLPVNFGGSVDEDALAWASAIRDLSKGAVALHCMCPYSVDLRNKINDSLNKQYFIKSKKLKEDLSNSTSTIERVMSKINKDDLGL